MMVVRINVPKISLFSSLTRFNRLAWGSVFENRPHGVIAAGMENGELVLWDPAKILGGARCVNILA